MNYFTGIYGQERPAPEFLSPVPIRKTRAGLQFTCAAPTLPPKGQSPDVWVSYFQAIFSFVIFNELCEHFT